MPFEVNGDRRVMIRPAQAQDDDEIWRVIEPTIRAGETYPLPRDLTKTDALSYWSSPQHEVMVAEHEGAIVGTYYLRANNRGGGAHVGNCGYIVAAAAGGRGIGCAMCLHSVEHARARGFRALQFNFVISTNQVAVRLWHRCGFEIVGRLPGAFEHPHAGFVDALVMYRRL